MRMRVNGWRVLAVTLVLVGCASGPTAPEGLIVADSMVVILTDLHLAEGYHSTPRTSGASPTLHPYARQRAAQGFEGVLRHHAVTMAQFDASLDYYLQQPYVLDTIYKQVVTRLDTLQARANQSPRRSP